MWFVLLIRLSTYSKIRGACCLFTCLPVCEDLIPPTSLPVRLGFLRCDREDEPKQRDQGRDVKIQSDVRQFCVLSRMILPFALCTVKSSIHIKNPRKRHNSHAATQFRKPMEIATDRSKPTLSLKTFHNQTDTQGNSRPLFLFWQNADNLYPSRKYTNTLLPHHLDDPVTDKQT